VSAWRVASITAASVFVAIFDLLRGVFQAQTSMNSARV
jgi:hypothetical protein